jgi:hypothetical protein
MVFYPAPPRLQQICDALGPEQIERVNDRATWRVQLEEARVEWRRRHAAAPGNR